jgi:hypothetical protein
MQIMIIILCICAFKSSVANLERGALRPIARSSIDNAKPLAFDAVGTIDSNEHAVCAHRGSGGQEKKDGRDVGEHDEVSCGEWRRYRSVVSG